MRLDSQKSEAVEKERRVLNPELNPKIPAERLAEKSKELKPEYHFEEMAEIESAVVEVVGQLKDAIEKGEYDALISDDAGGRIPTLILRKVFEKINPNKKIKTLFVAAGHSLPKRPSYDEFDNLYNMFRSDEEPKPMTAKEVERQKEENDGHRKLMDYLSEFKKKNHITKALVVTQYIFRGATMAGLLGALYETGLKSDVAALEIVFAKEFFNHYLTPGTKVFYAPKDQLARKYKSLEISNGHEKLSGVEKKEGEYSPVPVVTRKRDHPLQSYSEFKILLQRLEEQYYGENYNDYYKRPIIKDKKTEEKIWQEIGKVSSRPMTSEDTEKLQKDIILARKDIDLLVSRVMERI